MKKPWCFIDHFRKKGSRIVHIFSALSPPVSVSWYYPNKVPTTGWLKMTEIYCVAVLKATGPKPRAGRAALSLIG